MTEKLRGKDFVLIIMCLVVIAGGLVIGFKYFKKAFPEASIDFKVTRAGSKTIAQDFLSQRDYLLQSYRNAGGFEYDGYAKVFLEKELGLDKAQQYFGHPVKLWYWEQRWFKPEQKEEFSAQVTPEGEVIGFKHEIPEEQAGDSLSADSARVLAEAFLKGVMGKEISSLEYVTETHYTRPHRVDHYLTYKVRDFDPASDSDYRLEVTIQGNEVAGYREYLRVPEKWRQSYQELRSYNNTASSVASLFLVLTVVAMVAVIFSRIRKRDIRWKTALWFGLVGFLLLFLTQLNSLPLTMLGYDTTASYSGFLIKNIGLILLEALLGGGIVIAILTAAAETMYRERYGRFTAISSLFSWTSWRTKSFFKGVLLGLTLTAFFFAYQIIFYLTADKLGAWAPADVPYDDLLNTTFPWVAVLMIGFFPAVSEEFISRGFSIPFLHKYLKSGLLAVVIPAFIWGFGHSAYPNQPFFIRGLEVGFGGIIMGLVMLRWGILPALVWHYTVDALYTAFLLFRSGNWYFIVTAGVATGILLIPFLISLIAYLKTGVFLTPVGIRNQDEIPPQVASVEPLPSAVTPVPATVEIAYQPLTPGTRLKGVIIGVVCLLATLVPYHKLGENAPDFDLTPRQARQIADEYLIRQGVDVRGMRSAIGIDQRLDDNPGKYFLTHGGVDDFNRLTGSSYPPNVWEARRFVPGNRDEWRVSVNPATGGIVGFRHSLPEEAPGDSISADSARTTALTFLRGFGFPIENFTEKMVRADARPKRLDHTFTYEAQEGDTRNLQEAKYRVGTVVAGSNVTLMHTYYFLPEAWIRQQESTTALKAIFKVIRVIGVALFVGLAIFFLVKMSRQGVVPWKKAALIAIVPAAIIALNGVNFFPQQMFDYRVMIPIKMYSIQLLIAFLTQTIFIYLFWFLGAALLVGCYPNATQEFGGTHRRISGYDTLIAILLALCLAAFLTTVRSVLNSALPQWFAFSGIPITKALTGPVPFLDQLAESVQRLLAYSVVAGFGIYLWKNFLKSSPLRILAIILLLCALTPPEATELGEIVLSWIKLAIMLVALVFLATTFLRGNIVAYFAAIVAVTMFRAGLDLLSAGAGTYVVHGILLLILDCVILLWLITGTREQTLKQV